MNTVRLESLLQLQAMIQKDRIRQEFASFYQLLIEEERTVLDNIEMVIAYINFVNKFTGVILVH